MYVELNKVQEESKTLLPEVWRGRVGVGEGGESE